jgi:hypothetical protein
MGAGWNRRHSDDALLAAIKEHGSNRKAANALGISPSSIDGRIQRLRARGWDPKFDQTHPVPDGQIVAGVSTYYDDEGKIRGQWVKSRADIDSLRAMLNAAFEGMGDDLPRYKPVKVRKSGTPDLLNVFCITDFHLGMLSWGEETGQDWDLKIAERDLVRWFELAIERAPAADTAIFAQLGDMLHWDGLDAVTPEHKNLLDADTRFQKLVRTAIRVIRQVIAMLLAKHRKVHVIMAEGNHDPASSIWLREWLSAVFENEPRVSVDCSPDPYYCYEHGATSLFFHHGHKRKPDNVDDVFAAKFREVFGRTKHSYAHMGHRHHVDVKETNLMIVEQHRTLAAHDAYASRGGWLAGRDAKVITYSKAHGEVGRVIISSDMLKAA